MGRESRLPPSWGTPDRVQAGTQHFLGLTYSTGLRTALMSVFCGIALPQHSLVPNSSTDCLSKKMRLGCSTFQQESAMGLSPFTGCGALECRWHPLYEMSAAGTVLAGGGLFSAPPALASGCLLITLCQRVWMLASRENWEIRNLPSTDVSKFVISRVKGGDSTPSPRDIG